jgi:3-deoxy-manno-octulosonate cytidylyltransferase (CMP-KDO synthetase)
VSYKVIIPARFNASRLPGKPLLDIAGKTLIQHVYERACESIAEQVIIATDDKRIFDAAENFGAKVCMTREDHPSGTDRLAQVVTDQGFDDDDIVVNLQGDEPMLPAKLVDQVANALKMSKIASISTLCEPLTLMKEVFDPNIVKVVTDASGHALYFSRAPIPWIRSEYQDSEAGRSEINGQSFRHIGLYAYRVGFLRMYPTLQMCDLESYECLEQLRAMYHGYRIKVDTAICDAGVGVDTPADLEKVRALLT